MKRYMQAEVDAALEFTERNVFTPHSQIVLCGEVAALRWQARAARRCEEHGIVMYVAAGKSDMECWHCNDRARLQAQIESLQRTIDSQRELLRALEKELSETVRASVLLLPAEGS